MFMEEIIQSDVENEMQTSYISYAMSVIVGRALPDARDGLKPAQRRILFSMYKLNNTHDQPTKKSAKIIGHVIGTYHPHGDAAAYEVLVRMAQPFSMNYTLVEGQGNMGSIDGDPPAAQRYTEVRLSKIAEEVIADLEKQSVPFVPNFDNTEEEPLLLPTRIPNLLINGASGIAVGVATNILPHNLSEISEAVIAYIKNRDITPQELLQYVQGPDFPTGGTVFYNNALVSSYITGRGSVTIRGKIKFEKIKNKNAIIITEIPYTVNKATMVENIATLVRDKTIQGISGLRDESGKEGIRVVVELKQDADTDVMLNMLYKHTQLEISLPVMNIAVIGNNLVTLNLRQFIKIFVDHRIDVIRKRSEFDLKIATDRLHIVEGLLVAVMDIENVITTIKASKDVREARETLTKNYQISEKQASAILDMKLSRLTSLEIGSLEKEKVELTGTITDLSGILADESKIYGIISEETARIEGKYGRERRTTIDHNAPEKDLDREDLIIDAETSVILTSNNYIKRIPTNVYRSQDRGGKGVIAIQLKEGDFVKEIISCRLKDYLLIISSKGRAYWLKAYLVPEEGRYGGGKATVNLIKLSEGEKVANIINTKEFSSSFLVFITSKGKIKRIRAEKFSRPRANGIKAIPINESDELADVCLCDGKSELFIVTKMGKALRFKESDIRPMSRIAHGVRGIRLNPNDKVINVLSVNENDIIASIAEKGYGKVTEANKYRLQKRGGKGVINIKVKEKTGNVVRAIKVSTADNIILINSTGISITFPVNEIRKTGRAASGVRLMRLNPGAVIVDAQTITKYQPQQAAAEQAA
jgi:DNA gyrase subunit A